MTNASALINKIALQNDITEMIVTSQGLPELSPNILALNMMI